MYFVFRLFVCQKGRSKLFLNISYNVLYLCRKRIPISLPTSRTYIDRQVCNQWSIFYLKTTRCRTVLIGIAALCFASQ